MRNSHTHAKMKVYSYFSIILEYSFTSQYASSLDSGNSFQKLDSFLCIHCKGEKLYAITPKYVYNATCYMAIK